MATFLFRPGPYRPAPLLPLRFWKRSPQGDDDQPYLVYEGPHGPFEVFTVDDLHATEVRGQGIRPVRIPWGPHVKADRQWAARLHQGVTCEAEGVPIRFRGGGLRVTRANRAMQIDAGDRRYVYRLRRTCTFVVERAGGAAVVRFDRRRDGGWIADDADRLDVLTMVALRGSGLVEESRTFV